MKVATFSAPMVDSPKTLKTSKTTKQAYTALGVISLLCLVALLIAFCIRFFFLFFRANRHKEETARNANEHLILTKTYLPDLSDKITLLQQQVTQLHEQINQLTNPSKKLRPR